MRLAKRLGRGVAHLNTQGLHHYIMDCEVELGDGSQMVEMYVLNLS